MKKNHNKGFTLVETLVVAVFVTGVLIYMFIQFTAIQTSYQDSFTYNTVPGLYSASNINSYLIENEAEIIQSTLLKQIETSADKHVNLTNCSFASTINSQNFCKELVNRLKIKNLILTKSNLTDLRTYLKSNHPFDASLERFINRMDAANIDNQYRIIIQYQDNTCASIKLSYDI